MTKEEAAQKTTASLLGIARKHFTEYGYHNVSLEKIAEEGGVTRGAVYHHFKNKQGLFLAVLDLVQQDVARHIEGQAAQSDDPWQQLVLGCVGFVQGANTKSCRRILLVDAPAVAGWDTWRKADEENSQSVLQAHIADLNAQGFLWGDADPVWMARAISGALNELALQYPVKEDAAVDRALYTTVFQLVDGFKKQRR